MLIAVAGGLPSAWLGLQLLLLAIALAAMAVVVGWRTHGFAMFGVAVFLAVLLFGTTRTIIRTIDKPYMHGIAVFAERC